MLLKPKKSTWAIVTFYSAADSVLDDVCAISKVYYVITHIPVKARRNIIPFLEHAVFLEAAIVNRWCNICVCGYTQLPPHLRYQSALTFARVISLSVMAVTTSYLQST